MAALNLQLPESLRRAVRDLAGKEGVSIEQLATTASAEKISALQTLDYLRTRAAAGNLEDSDRALSLVPDIEPVEESDRIF